MKNNCGTVLAISVVGGCVFIHVFVLFESSPFSNPTVAKYLAMNWLKSGLEGLCDNEKLH